MLNLAERFGQRALNSNPCRHIPRYPELSRKRFATLDELVRVGVQLDCWKWKYPDSVAFIALILFTGMRPGEVDMGRREWITGDVLELPDTKTGQRPVYLSAHALALIGTLPAPAKVDGLTPLVGVKYPRWLWERIRRCARCSDLRLYDLRRTFATVSLGAGQSIGLIGEVLGHKTVQTTKVYARLQNEAAQGLVGATGDRMQNLLGRV